MVKTKKTSSPTEVYVIKRDGEQMLFDVTLIESAIKKASDHMNKENRISKEEITTIAKEVESEFTMDPVNGPIPSVENIQDSVISHLNLHNHLALAKAYKDYRETRTYNRLKDAKVMRDIHSSLIPDKKKKKNQNANLDELSFGGRKGEAESTLLKYLAKNDLMRKIDIIDWESTRRYPHDSDSYFLGEHNCLSCPVDMLFEKGFNTRQTDIRPASSLNTAFQLLAVIFQLQSLQQFGGVSATHLDVSMIPYFRMSFYKYYLVVADIIPFINSERIKSSLNFDKFGAKKISVRDPKYIGYHWWNFIKRYIARKALILTKKELKQAVEGMYHNLNTLQSRSGEFDCPAA